MGVSACLIAKAPSLKLDRAVASIRPLVDEVCLLWTCKPRGFKVSPGVDIVDYYDGCNAKAACSGPCGCQPGDLLDFSMARARSFSLARWNLRTYLDSDDEVSAKSGARLEAFYEPAAATYFPYEYAFDTKGECTLRHYTLRIVGKSGSWHWPVHNALDPNEPISRVKKCEQVVWKHRRSLEGVRASALRSLRMHLHWQSDPRFSNDSRFLYYLGRAHGDLGAYGAASVHLERALSLETDVDQKAVIALDLARCYPPRYALLWAHKALELRPEWPSTWLLLAVTYHKLGKSALARTFWRGAVSCDPPDTLLGTDPSELERAARLLGLRPTVSSAARPAARELS